MNELVEAKTLAGDIEREFKGHLITKVVVMNNEHKFAFFSNKELFTSLVGNVIQKAYSVANFIVIETDKYTFNFSEGASPILYRQKKDYPQKHQLLIEFEDELALVFTVKMYGFFEVFGEEGTKNPYFEIALNKPSLLGHEFDYPYFKNLPEGNYKLSVKEFLATNQRIPGLGNGTLQDILFVARINPKTRLSELSEEQFKSLFEALKEVTKRMLEFGGRDVEKDLYNKPYKYKTIMSNNTYKECCPCCKGQITKEAYLGGSVYYCATCQPIQPKKS